MVRPRDASPVSQVCLTVTETEYKIVKSRARTLSLIGGGVEPLGAEEEELKGCRELVGPGRRPVGHPARGGDEEKMRGGRRSSPSSSSPQMEAVRP